MLKGKIIKNISNIYRVKVANTYYDCQPRGKFRKLELTPLVGDEVEIDEKNNYILDIMKRQNELDRPKVSNVDIALIVTSLKEPDLSLNLLDKEIVSIILAHIKPIICFTKLDKATKKELQDLNNLRKYYENIGIKTFTNTEIPQLTAYLKNKYIVLTGQTGAGKSSLINKIDSSKNLLEGEISYALGRGKHTTRHTEFHLIKDFYIADTPGFSSLSLEKYSNEEIKNAFKEFANSNCLYKDCSHIKEEDCEIKKLVNAGKILKSRYENYCSFVRK